MESVAISQFRQNMPLFLKKVKNGQSITLTSRGRQVAMLVPVTDERAAARQALDQLARTAHVGDVLSPIDVEWNALS